jgi:hypothetical protein
LYHYSVKSPARRSTRVDVSWWVTPDAYARGYYTKLYAALRRWVLDQFPFGTAYYSNREIPPD